MRLVPWSAAVVMPLLLASATSNDTFDLAGDRVRPASTDRHVDYRLDLAGQQAMVRQPAGVRPGERLGLLVYVPPGDGVPRVPDGWAAVLDERRLVFVGLAGAGNGQPVSRRCGLAVVAAGRALRLWPAIDRDRVYAAGTSGGARVAGLLGFYQPDLFRGTIQCCGTDYFHRLPHASAAAQYQAGGPLLVDQTEADRAKPRVAFALVTGDRDPGHDLVVDTFHGGFEHDHFRAVLLDGPGRGHAPADGPTFAAAVAFLDQPRPGLARRPATRPR